MKNVTRQDIDDACAGYARATQEYPRREGIRCALLATRQLAPMIQPYIEQMLRQEEANYPTEVAHIRAALGLAHE